VAPVDLSGIAEPHRSTVTAIVELARQGLLSDAQALLMIARVRAAAGPGTADADSPCES
jgi:hypothetical protein